MKDHTGHIMLTIHRHNTKSLAGSRNGPTAPHESLASNFLGKSGARIESSWTLANSQCAPAKLRMQAGADTLTAERQP